MARIELIMPKMGESITDATILKWRKKAGDPVKMDEVILEIATDKVDSEVASPSDGKITEILYNEDAVVDVGKVIAIIETDVNAIVSPSPATEPVSIDSDTQVTPDDNLMAENVIIPPSVEDVKVQEQNIPNQEQIPIIGEADHDSAQRFYSPLVRSIAKEEKIPVEELDKISGTGANGRLTKYDIISYLQNRDTNASSSVTFTQPAHQNQGESKKPVTTSGNVDIVEMDRMRKLIADHMVMSKQTSPHVTSFVEADVTNLVQWREKNKGKFKDKYGENLTFTPLFIDAVVRALKDFPMVNISLDGNRILVKKDINIGMAAALPSGNLIVPVVKNADLLSLAGLAKTVNDLAIRARENKLKPEEIKDGTFTITNVGTFGNLMGTPIINQPQVAILATGAICKKPAVLETEFGDVIAIRHLMFLSLSYDHRIVDGALGGAFLKRISDYLEKFDQNTAI
ncbi:MAG: 2-oxo acid dehydrogenase subunit E2 [Saprospiraceae bacterium]|nr:2-oxo acid dehydrogenase subunit E2 [Saprospiraceae bacterium]